MGAFASCARRHAKAEIAAATFAGLVTGGSDSDSDGSGRLSINGSRRSFSGDRLSEAWLRNAANEVEASDSDSESCGPRWERTYNAQMNYMTETWLRTAAKSIESSDSESESEYFGPWSTLTYHDYIDIYADDSWRRQNLNERN
jgi:hypothetical protein